jgi:hypothetical protein
MRVTNEFPNKEQVLTEDFKNFENFFPIATVEIEEDGETIPIHVVYTFFEATNADEQFFSDGEYGGNFSFQIVGNRCRPTFKKNALQIEEDYQQFLDEAIEKYNECDKSFSPIEFLSEPEWWQFDDTPNSETGEPMKFICQLDLADIVDDDCRMFVFFDQASKKIRTVYQRD